MKMLIVIPHAYLPGTPGLQIYGSERSSAEVRAAALLRCISALHQTFGTGQHMVSNGLDPQCNATTASSLDVVLCTTGDAHLADSVPSHLAHRYSTGLAPRLLGFAAQSILRRNAGLFDWYGYLEDDCEITDGLLFSKLAWFNTEFGVDALLQPNRYEISAGPLVQKLYIDGRIAGAPPPTQPPGSLHLEATTLGRRWRFRRVSNPHSGCFFADAGQMARIASDPAFGHYSDAFVGPLESAATLPVLRNFAVYKPAMENATFLEMRHIDQRLLDERLFFTVTADGAMVRTVTPEWGAPPPY